MSDFNVEEATKHLIEATRKWFDENGKECNAVIGISGGKDSSVCAAICKEALGTNRVIGVMMPNGVQYDIEDSIELINHLGILYTTVDISSAYYGVLNNIGALYYRDNCGIVQNGDNIVITEQTKTNLPARLRMSTLYAVSQSLNGRVINTCNLSEDWIGYSTRYGDAAGDVSILGNYTVDEVLQIGKALGLPDELVYKIPSDGLCGKSDEDNLGFSYTILDKYIRTGICDDEDVKLKIDFLHSKNQFKLNPIPVL